MLQWHLLSGLGLSRSHAINSRKSNDNDVTRRYRAVCEAQCELLLSPPSWKYLTSAIDKWRVGGPEAIQQTTGVNPSKSTSSVQLFASYQGHSSVQNFGISSSALIFITAILIFCLIFSLQILQKATLRQDLPNSCHKSFTQRAHSLIYSAFNLLYMS